MKIKHDPTIPSIGYVGDCLAGVDEVGRGPLAGDVVAAAVILDPMNVIEGLRDSKKLTAARRDALYECIYEQATAVAVGRASVAEIDQHNILNASLLAMHRAVANLKAQPEYVLVDGNRLPSWDYPSEAIVKGDNLFDCISAASIIAKVVRDREMIALAQEYPEYQFDRHKGYPTAVHLQALEEHGASIHHRKSFAPVRRILQSTSTSTSC